MTGRLLTLALCAAVTASARGYGEDAPCFAARRTLGSPLPGQHVPECDRSGGYTPRQCHGSRCFCVDRAGSRLQEYQDVGRHEADQIACGCARQKLDQAGRLGGAAVVCDARGDFAPQQCVGSSCHCVNVRTGSRLARSREVHVAQLASLDCSGADGAPARTAGGAQYGGDTPCWDALRQHESRPQGLLGAERPECDRLGRYHPKQCRGSQCFCVSPAGEPLQPYQAVPRAQTLHCGCARRLHEIQQSQLVGVLLSCDRHGDYERQQCTGSVCHCVDPVTGERAHDSPTQPIHKLTQLSCSDQPRGPKTPLLGGQTPCWDELRKHQAQATPLLGAHRPECDRTGRYHPKQCKGSECVCVDPYGGPLEGYRKSIGEAAEMRCLCARREWEIRRDGLLGTSVRCDPHGNFAEYQCVGSVCHCVSAADGAQLPGSETPIGQLASLDCSTHRRRLLGSERPCEDRLRELRAGLSGGYPPPGYEEPACQRDGRFEPTQCSGAVCYCVTPDGDRMDGYEQSRQHQQRMSCECARRSWELTRDGLGRSLTCDQFGGYHHSQCEGSSCYCVDPATGAAAAGTATVHISQLSSLQCGSGSGGSGSGGSGGGGSGGGGSGSSDGQGRLLGADTPCWDERRRLEQRQQLSPYPLVGLEMPECDRSGRHQPKQCRGSQCFCVDPAGAQLDQYTADRWQADNMHCVCARREHEIQSSRLVGVSTSCDRLGNFERRQCLGSSCYCVDPHTGAQVDPRSVHISDSHSLNCAGGGGAGGHGGAGHSGGAGGHGGAGHSGGAGGHGGGGGAGGHGGAGHSGGAGGGGAGGAGGHGGGAGGAGGQAGSGYSGGGRPLLGGTGRPAEPLTGAGRQLVGADTPCWDERTRLMHHMDTGLRGASLPECDRSGRYEPKQCKGNKCFCVDPSGVPIVGYERNLWDANDMHCNCVRRQHELRETGRLGHSVVCNELGNFHSHQCQGSSCYCVDHLTGERSGTEAVHVSEVARLQQLCAALGASHKCWDERRAASQSGRLGAHVPECDLYGQYQPKQCKGSQCICVDDENGPIAGFSAHVSEAAAMSCNCAREQWQQRQQGTPQYPLRCDRLGNFEPQQCAGAHCYPVDPMTGHRQPSPQQQPQQPAGPQPSSSGRPCDEAARRLAGSGRQPQCERDGSYSARQCHRGACFCADAAGQQLAQYRSRADQPVTCHCARREHEVRSSGVRGLSVSCDARGDYAPHQCLGSTCYCVHVGSGQRRRDLPEVHIAQLRELNCGAQPLTAQPAGY